jgi:hypothetical protein
VEPSQIEVVRMRGRHDPQVSILAFIVEASQTHQYRRTLQSVAGQIPEASGHYRRNGDISSTWIHKRHGVRGTAQVAENLEPAKTLLEAAQPVKLEPQETTSLGSASGLVKMYS